MVLKLQFGTVLAYFWNQTQYFLREVEVKEVLKSACSIFDYSEKTVHPISRINVWKNFDYICHYYSN